LTDDQKQRRLHISSAILHNAEMFGRIIKGDEAWCFQCDPKAKRQSMQEKTQTSPQQRKARTSRSQFKTMLVSFFYHKSIVHYEFIAQGQTVNQQCYLEVLTRIRESVRRKRPKIWRDKWILHHNNAPAHDAFRVCEFQVKKSITKMDHSPYSINLAPTIFRSFKN
jgi:hypothetical protein